MRFARAVQKYNLKGCYGIRVTAVSSNSPVTETWTSHAVVAYMSHCRISLAAPIDKINHAPASTLALSLPPFDLLRSEHFEPCPELLRLLPVPPDAPQRFRATPVLRRPPPREPQAGLVLQQTRPAPVARSVLVRGMVLLNGQYTPLPCVVLVLDQLFVHCVRNQRDRLSRKPELRAERSRKLFWRERREQIPFYVVGKVVIRDLDVNLVCAHQDECKAEFVVDAR